MRDRGIDIEAARARVARGPWHDDGPTNMGGWLVWTLLGCLIGLGLLVLAVYAWAALVVVLA